MIMAVFMRVMMSVIMIASRVIVLMFHRVRIPLMLECLHAPQPRKKTRAHKTVTTIVATPPITMAGTNPNQAAVVPDSNSPSSFDAPINTALTALTRPRISSGVCSCTSSERTNTLIMSPAPKTTSAIIATQNTWVKPSTRVAMPNAATPANMVTPTCRDTGLNASQIAIAPAPMPGAARK